MGSYPHGIVAIFDGRIYVTNFEDKEWFGVDVSYFIGPRVCYLA